MAMGHLAGASLAKRSGGVQHIDKPAVDEPKWAIVALEHDEFRSTHYLTLRRRAKPGLEGPVGTSSLYPGGCFEAPPVQGRGRTSA